VTGRGFPEQSLAILLERDRQRQLMLTLEHRESRSVKLVLWKFAVVLLCSFLEVVSMSTTLR